MFAAVLIAAVSAAVIPRAHMGAGTVNAQEQTYAGVYQVTTATETSGQFVSFEYPVVTGIDGYDQSIVEQINRYFKDEAVKTVQEEAQNMEAVYQDILEFNSAAADSLCFEVKCSGIYLEGDILSVRQDYYSYSGGAHGYGFPVGTTFDLRTGEELTMGEILGCDEATAQEAVVEAYRKEIIGQVENITEESIRGCFDIMEYWKQEDGMYVNIAPYNVASYAAGQQQALVTQEILDAAANKTADGSAQTEGSASGSGQEMITVIGGIQAPASDFIFPHSSTALLTDSDLLLLDAETVEERHYRSQLAINEILARYGYTFSPEQGGAAKEAYDQFEGKEWYEQAKPYCPSSSANDMLYTYISDTELQNVDLICEWQKQNGCYY